jgi:uncharacterized protein (DUF1015 family)
MVKISAFTGITYNPDKVKIDKNLFAPPYDVISPDFQDVLYERSFYNVVRLILGKVNDNDDEKNNRYLRAANDYNDWLEQGVLVRSDLPKMYFYIQKYKDAKGVDVVRKGFIARCYLEDFSSRVVLPHEETMGGPKEDRLRLMTAAKANFSQIFSIYSDPDLTVDKVFEAARPDKPLVEVVDDDDVRHIFYEITDKSAIEMVKAFMADKNVLIADGHHRYETALKYRDQRRAEDNNDISEDKPYNSVMMYFANLDDEGLRVYPTHRALMKAVDVPFDDLLGKLEPYFAIEKNSFKDVEECFAVVENAATDCIATGLLSAEQSGVLYLLKPYYEKVKDLLVSQGVPEILIQLDVTILHRLIFEYIMGLDTVVLKNQHNIEFIRDEKELVDKYNKGVAHLVFLVSTPDVSTVRDICMSGHRMPQKTTYFYPKLLSGLVLNPLA